MSGIVQHCEIEKLDKDPLDSKNILTVDRRSDRVAVDLLNDIVENALDSVLDEKIDNRRMDDIVGDIADQYTPRATRLVDLYDDPCDIKNRRILTATEEEVKKFIGEISSPSTKGTGDQLLENEEIITKKKSFSLTRNFALEKKTRLTDLVKNSKSLISKFLSNDSTQKDTEWEEHSEEFVKSIELDQINAEKEENKSPTAIKARPVSSSNSGEMLKIPDEVGMENINLMDIRGQLSEHEYEEEMDYVQKSMTFPKAGCSKITIAEHEEKEAVKDKKKWHLGSKIVNYIKKKTSRRDITKSEM